MPTYVLPTTGTIPRIQERFFYVRNGQQLRPNQPNMMSIQQGIDELIRLLTEGEPELVAGGNGDWEAPKRGEAVLRTTKPACRVVDIDYYSFAGPENIMAALLQTSQNGSISRRDVVRIIARN